MHWFYWGMRISASTNGARNVFPNILQMLGNVHSKLAYQPTNTSFSISFTKRYKVSTSTPIPTENWLPHPPSHPWPTIKGSRSPFVSFPRIAQTSGLGKKINGPNKSSHAYGRTSGYNASSTKTSFTERARMSQESSNRTWLQMKVNVVCRKFECRQDIHHKTQTETSCEKCNSKAFRLGI